MKARDLMTPGAIAVRLDTPTERVAELMLEHNISACPVIDENGKPTGMVSEEDLIFALFAEGEPVSEEFVARIPKSKRTARDVMGGPIVAVTEETDVAEIARILIQYRIKRVPVVRGGRLVGIVSRADLLRALVRSIAATNHPDMRASLS